MLKNFLLLLASSYVCLLAINLVLNLLPDKTTPPPVPAAAQFCDANEGRTYRFYERMGAVLIRDSEVGWVYSPDNFGNRKGYLGPCYPYRKAPGTKRVVLLGDSFTGATTVAYADSFAARLPLLLKRYFPNQKIEVVNLGVGGYGTDQQYFTLINEARRYSPDLVVHNIFLGNDISDNSWTLSRAFEYVQNRNHPNKRYAFPRGSRDLSFGRADLDYYFEWEVSDELTLPRKHGGGAWKFDGLAGLARAEFAYDGEKLKLKGQFFPGSGEKDSSPIAGIDFLPREKGYFTLTLAPSKRKIRVLHYDRENSRMDGVEEGSSRAWQARYERAEMGGPINVSYRAKIKEGLRQSFNFFKLSTLTDVGKKALLSNYHVASFLFRHGLADKKWMPAFYFVQEQGGYNLQYKIFLKQSAPVWDEAWEVTFRLVEKMRHFTETNLKVPYLVFTIPAMESVYPAYWKEAQKTFPELLKDAPDMDTALPHTKMETYFTERRYLNHGVLPDFQAHFAATRRLLYGLSHAHLNEEGHAIYAELLAKKIGTDLNIKAHLE